MNSLTIGSHPKLFAPLAFAKALVAASRAHCENTLEEHFVGDIENVLTVAFAGLTLEQLRSALRCEAAKRLLVQSPDPKKATVFSRRALKNETRARRAAYLVAEELGFSPPVTNSIENEDRLCAEVIAEAFTLAGPDVMQRIVNAVCRENFCLCAGDFPAPYCELMKEAEE